MGWIIFAVILFLFLVLLFSRIRDWIILIYTMEEQLLITSAMIIVIGVAVGAKWF